MGKRKKNNKWGIIGGFAIFLIFIAILSYQQFSIEDLEQQKYIEAPKFGYIACEQGSSNTVTKTMSGDFGQILMDDPVQATAYTCGDFLGLVDSCTITMTVTDGDLSDFISYQAQLDYDVVETGTTSGENEFTTVSGGVGGYDNYEKFTVTLNSDDILWVRYIEGDGLTGFTKYNGKVQIVVTGIQYTLYNYNDLSSANGQVLEGAREGSCILEDDALKKREIDYASPDLKELSNQANYLDYENLNKINGRYTYFAGFTPVPSFASQIEYYEGQTVYCMDRKLYATIPIESNGYTYEVVNYDASGEVSSVVCCNGEEQPGYLCINHKWVKQEEAECDLSAGIFCPQSTYQPSTGSTYKRYVCEDNMCVADVITAECNDNDDCDGSDVCVRYSDPARNQCVESGDSSSSVCGDNKCEFNELTSCPLDCSGDNDNTFNLSGGALLIILGFVMIILIMIAIKVKQNRGQNNNKLFG